MQDKRSDFYEKNKKIVASLTALMLVTAMSSLSLVFAQENIVAESNVISMTEMPVSQGTTQSAQDLLEEALQFNSSPEDMVYNHEKLCADLGVSALSELDYSVPYYCYDFYTQELSVAEKEDSYTYWILLYQDGAYYGNLSVTPTLGLIQVNLRTYSCVQNALEQQDEIWFGSAIVGGLPAELVYTGGVIYQLNFGETKTDLVWGHLPSSAYDSGMEIDAGTTPAVTTSAEENVPILGDVNLDNIIDLKDVVLLNKAANNAVVLNVAQMQNADCYADHELNAQDAISLMRFLVHIIDNLPEDNVNN